MPARQISSCHKRVDQHAVPYVGIAQHLNSAQHLILLPALAAHASTGPGTPPGPVDFVSGGHDAGELSGSAQARKNR